MPLILWGGAAALTAIGGYFIADKAEEAVVESSNALTKLTLAVALAGGLYLVGKHYKAW